MKISESEEQKKLVQWLCLKKIFHFSVANENQQSSTNKVMAIKIASKHKAMGRVSGTCDIFVLLPNIILAIEMKTAPTKLKSGELSKSRAVTSDNQKKFISDINEFDYVDSKVCYGFSDSREYIESFITNSNTN